MPVIKATIHVISATRTGPAFAIDSLLGPRARVVRHSTWPAQGAFGGTDLVVLDLDDLPAVPVTFPLTTVQLWPRKVSVYLVAGEKAVAPGWLGIALQSGVQLINCSREERSKGFKPLVTRLVGHLDGPSAVDLTASILRHEPRLASAEVMILSICASPWQVRRPVDLARATGWSVLLVKRMCRALGFTRIEHFITQVRMLALEAVVGGGSRVPLPLARNLVGITDPSNLRKQAKRAHRGSPMAFRSAS